VIASIISDTGAGCRIRRHLADDDADRLAASDRADADGGQFTGPVTRDAGRRVSRHPRRRRLLLFWLTWMVAAAAILGLLTTTGWIGVGSLLFLTFLLSIGGP